MQTRILPVNPQSLQQAATVISEGGVVAFGTETVYGLGANALDPRAVARIYEAKGRPSDNPLIVHLADAEQIPTVARIDAELLERLKRVLPAPLTVILDKLPVVPSVVTAGLDTVGVRVPACEGARAFLRAVGTPIAAPSANTSTRPSPTTARHVYEDLGGRIPLILDTGDCAVGVESTIVRVKDGVATVYRPGGMTPEQLTEIFGTVVFPDDAPVDRPLAPGMKYRHYAPSVPVYLAKEGDIDAAKAFYDECKAKGRQPVILAQEDKIEALRGYSVRSLGASNADVAHALFYELREAEKHYDAIVTFELSGGGHARAVNNRLRKASSGRT